MYNETYNKGGNRMKKVLTGLAAMMLLLTGCGGSSSAKSTTCKGELNGVDVTVTATPDGDLLKTVKVAQTQEMAGVSDYTDAQKKLVKEASAKQFEDIDGFDVEVKIGDDDMVEMILTLTIADLDVDDASDVLGSSLGDTKDLKKIKFDDFIKNMEDSDLDCK